MGSWLFLVGSILFTIQAAILVGAAGSAANYLYLVGSILFVIGCVFFVLAGYESPTESTIAPSSNLISPH